MSDKRPKGEERDERADGEGLHQQPTDVHEAAEDWPPKGSAKAPARPTVEGTDAVEKLRRARADTVPARSHRFDPDAIESMLEDDSKHPTLITLTGPRAGETTRLESDRIVIGRHRDEVDVWIGDRGVSRQHASLERGDDGYYYLRDLKSSNGTYVNGEEVTEPRRLDDGDKIVLSRGTVLRFSVQDSLDEHFQRHMYESSVRDGLTDAYSRVFLEEQMRSDMAFTDRHDTESALIFLDIDHFKEINDEHGHLVGDGILVELAEIVRSEIRGEDLLARYGGEEFAILLRNTDRESLDRICERIRTRIASTTFEVREAEVEMTVSLGGALYVSSVMRDPQDWIAAADRALYAAKASGRNCTRIYDYDAYQPNGEPPPVRR